MILDFGRSYSLLRILPQQPFDEVSDLWTQRLRKLERLLNYFFDQCGVVFVVELIRTKKKASFSAKQLRGQIGLCECWQLK